MESFKELFEMVKEYTRQYVIDSKELSEIAYQVWIKSLERSALTATPPFCTSRLNL